MTFQVRHVVFRGLFAAIGLLLTMTQAQAQNWETGRTVFVNNCIGCHDPEDRENRTSGQITSAISSVTDMQGISLSSGDLTDLVEYLKTAHIHHPRVTLLPAAPGPINFTAVSAGLTRTQNVTVTNTGLGDPLTISASVSDNTNYGVNLNGCGTIAQGVSCNIIVTFRPQSVGTFNSRTLTINHNTFVTSSAITLNGTGLDPFTVAPASPVTFTPATAPTGLTRVVTITDNKGDSIRVCRVAASSFSAPTDYTLEAPGAFDGSGCYTHPAGAAPRSIGLTVRFIPGAPGPRNANLEIQRVVGVPTGALTTVQLQGNPGPFATVNASSLFDDPVNDPGVEVDNDNTLTRTVTVFSQGSSPVPFNGSSFVISGPSAGEYTLAGTGCQAIAQLPAFSGGSPPSCVLTVVFNPSDVGRRGPATLTIQAAGTNTNTVSLNGLGFRGPRLAVRRGVTPLASGDVVQFGAQTIGGLYPAISLTLNNGGTLGNLDVILPAAGSVAGFTFAAGAGCAQLAPGANCTVDLRFDPAAVQAYASPFVVQTRPSGTADAVKVFSLDLRGQGTATAVPVLTWTDTTGTPITRLDFADTDTGSPRTATIRLANTGPGGARLQFANAVGLDAPNYVLDTSDCGDGRDLFENTSCAVVVQFAPGTAGLKTASLQYAAGAGTSLMLIVSPMLPTSGTAIGSATPATLEPSVSTLQFAGTVVGASATPLELRLTNLGSRSLNVLGLDATAPFQVQSKTCASLPFVLPPGGECTVTVSFLPTAEGAMSGTLSITSDASVAVTEIALSGAGQPKADLSSGGCAIVSGDAATDPTLWTLVLLAALALLYRRHARRATRDGQRRP